MSLATQSIPSSAPSTVALGRLERHPPRFALRPHIAHKIPGNLRLHVVTSVIAWLALTTLLSQIALPISVPVLGANAGACFAVLSALYWLSIDVLTAATILLLTTVWASVPRSPWGPGHGVLAGVVMPLIALGLMRFIEFYSHVYHHEHSDFLRGGSPLESALEESHVAIFGAFHFVLGALLRVGYRPRLKARLDEAERRATLRREHVPWINWARTAECRPRLVCVPQSVRDLADIVREAGERGSRVRVVASGFSWSSIATTNDVLVFCERLDGITLDLSDPEHPAVWAEAGVTNRQLNRVLQERGLTMPWNVVLENVRIAGIVSVGTHGSGKDTRTMGDLVEVFEVIDARGELRVISEETVGAEGMNAARVGLGLFGVIARVKLRVIPNYRVRQVDERRPVADILAGIADLVRAHDSVELYWFAFNRQLWLRTIDRTDEPRGFAGHGFGFKATNFAQNFWFLWTTRFVERFARWLSPSMMRVGFRFLDFRARVLDLAESQHYRRWIEMMKCGCVEVGFKIDPGGERVRSAFATAERLVEEYARRGLYPMNLTLNVRFIGPSDALLTPAHGDGITCYIEALCLGKPEGWREFSAELCAEWMKIDGALPHWAKEFEHVPGIAAIVRRHLGDRRRRYLDALSRAGVDPRGAFVNPMIEQILLGE